MSGAEHTPLPWFYRKAKFPTDGEYDYGISAEINGQQYCIGEMVGICANDIKLPVEANAALIVTAVNERPALLRRVAELEAENKRVRDALRQFVACCDTAPPTSLVIEIGMACKVARAALSTTERGAS